MYHDPRDSNDLPKHATPTSLKAILMCRIHVIRCRSTIQTSPAESSQFPSIHRCVHPAICHNVRVYPKLQGSIVPPLSPRFPQHSPPCQLSLILQVLVLGILPGRSQPASTTSLTIPHHGLTRPPFPSSSLPILAVVPKGPLLRCIAASALPGIPCYSCCAQAPAPPSAFPFASIALFRLRVIYGLVLAGTPRAATVVLRPVFLRAAVGFGLPALLEFVSSVTVAGRGGAACPMDWVSAREC
ncbi:hypothetical protein VTK26DRAFT_706 [Humicola hyalothermophila]